MYNELTHARDLGFKIAVIKIDSLRVVQSLKTDLQWAPNATLLSNIKVLLTDVHCSL